MTDIEADFVAHFGHVPLGAAWCYHTGLLAKDRIADNLVDAIGGAAWWGYQAGLGFLTQQRGEPYICDYIFTRSHLPFAERANA